MNTNLTQSQLRHYHEQGFLVCPDFLNPPELEEWRTTLAEALARVSDRPWQLVVAGDGRAVLAIDEFGGEGGEDLGVDLEPGEVDDGHLELVADGAGDLGAGDHPEADEDAVEAFTGGALLAECGLELRAGDHPAFDEQHPDAHSSLLRRGRWRRSGRFPRR